VVDGELVYVATQEGYVSAFTVETGTEVWHYKSDNLLFGSPAVAEGVLVIADEGGVVMAIDARTGRELWQKSTGGEAFTTPAIARGVAFVATNEPSLTAFDLKSGSKRWSREIGGESSPAAGDGMVFLGGDDQSVRALDAATGETRWSSPLGYAIRSSVTFADDAVYIGSGPTLTAIERHDGRTLWTHVTGDVVTADLAVVAETVIASSHDGYVYALGPAERNPAETDRSLDS
jgi:eukaryotic-like serine/threonine-protein kinase